MDVDEENETNSASNMNQTWVRSKSTRTSDPDTTHTFRSTANAEARENAKFGKNLRKENNHNRSETGYMGSKNTLVPGNLEWDNGTGCFRESPVKEHPIVNLELTVMVDQLRTWHTKISASEESHLPRSLRSP